MEMEYPSTRYPKSTGNSNSSTRKVSVVRGFTGLKFCQRYVRPHTYHTHHRTMKLRTHHRLSPYVQSAVLLAALLSCSCLVSALAPSFSPRGLATPSQLPRASSLTTSRSLRRLPATSSRCRIQYHSLYAKLTEKRKKELGVADDEDEYDLSKALDANTDPLITKIIAGSLIFVIIGLLIVAVIVPLTTDYTDSGLCNPIVNAGRC
jgi:hypothetical protein